MSSSVLDSSAVFAVINWEPGAQAVIEAITGGAAVSSMNVAEVVTRLADQGLSPADIDIALARVEFEIVDFDADLAMQCGLLRPLTRQAGLSLGDRACLALA